MTTSITASPVETEMGGCRSGSGAKDSFEAPPVITALCLHLVSYQKSPIINRRKSTSMDPTQAFSNTHATSRRFEREGTTDVHRRQLPGVQGEAGQFRVNPFAARVGELDTITVVVPILLGSAARIAAAAGACLLGRKNVSARRAAVQGGHIPGQRKTNPMARAESAGVRRFQKGSPIAGFAMPRAASPPGKGTGDG